MPRCAGRARRRHPRPAGTGRRVVACGAPRRGCRRGLHRSSGRPRTGVDLGRPTAAARRTAVAAAAPPAPGRPPHRGPGRPSRRRPRPAARRAARASAARGRSPRGGRPTPAGRARATCSAVASSAAIAARGSAPAGRRRPSRTAGRAARRRAPSHRRGAVGRRRSGGLPRSAGTAGHARRRAGRPRAGPATRRPPRTAPRPVRAAIRVGVHRDDGCRVVEHRAAHLGHDARRSRPRTAPPMHGAPHRPISARAHAPASGAATRGSRREHWRSVKATCEGVERLLGRGPAGERADVRLGLARPRDRRPAGPRARSTAGGRPRSVSRTQGSRSGKRDRRLYRGECSAIRRSSRTRASSTVPQTIGTTALGEADHLGHPAAVLGRREVAAHTRSGSRSRCRRRGPRRRRRGTGRRPGASGSPSARCRLRRRAAGTGSVAVARSSRWVMPSGPSRSRQGVQDVDGRPRVGQRAVVRRHGRPEEGGEGARACGWAPRRA